MAYVSVAELAKFLRIQAEGDDGELGQMIDSASAAVDAWCGQTFEKQAAATARTFVAEFTGWLDVDPFGTATGLLIDGAAFDPISHRLYPLNQRAAGLTDHPYNRIRAVTTSFTPGTAYAVTAAYGWPSGVPDSVRDAAMFHAARLHERRKNPAGIALGAEAAFPTRTSLGLDPDVKSLLAPYVRTAQWT